MDVQVQRPTGTELCTRNCTITGLWVAHSGGVCSFSAGQALPFPGLLCVQEGYPAILHASLCRREHCLGLIAHIIVGIVIGPLLLRGGLAHDLSITERSADA